MRAVWVLFLTTTVLATTILGAAAARAEGDRAGRFDYYVLALSWQSTWCALQGDARSAPDCEAGRNRGWVLHGLWPQYERGWPAYCPSPEPAPSRQMTSEMADIMGSAGLAWHQWNKHGRCSGLSAAAYFDLSRRAYERIARPEVFRKLDRPVRLPAEVVEEAFLRANPSLSSDTLVVTCTRARIHEVRLCLTKALAPRPCSADVQRRNCPLPDARLDPVR